MWLKDSDNSTFSFSAIDFAVAELPLSLPDDEHNHLLFLLHYIHRLFGKTSLNSCKMFKSILIALIPKSSSTLIAI